MERSLVGALRTFTPFDASFPGVGTFPGVLYLAPKPAWHFRRLTKALFEAFPLYPPYAGQHADVTPHLTVGHFDTHETLKAAREEIGDRLAAEPLARVHVAGLALMENVSGRWAIGSTFPFGDAAGDHDSV